MAAPQKFDNGTISIPYDPSATGLAAVLWTRALDTSTGFIWLKTGTGSFNWTQITGGVTPSLFSVADAEGMAPASVIRQAFAAGVGGAADDVVIIASAPFAFRVVDSKMLVSTAVALATGTLRDAAGGGGTALSDALAASTVGTRRDLLLTVTGTVPAAGTLVLRRSDNTFAGEVVVFIEKEP